MIYDVCRKANCPDANKKDKTCNPGACGITLEEKGAVFVEPFVIRAHLNIPESKEE